MKLAVPDLISNSYFPAVAAVELGLFARQGLDVALELMVPIEQAFAAMRSGTLDFLGCSAHLMVGGFPEWRGARLLCAQAQGMYWFLVMRCDLGARRGELDVLKGRRIGAAPWVAMGLTRLLAEAGLDLERDAIRSHPSRARTAPAPISASLPRRRSPTARSTASGRTAWARSSRCGAASARSCSMFAAAKDPSPASTIRFPRSPRPRR